MQRVLAALYSACSYLFFLVTFVYAILFVEGIVVPKTIDSGVVSDPAMSVVVNLAVLGVFAMQHSVMARPAFKRWWTKFVPAEIERSTYVLFATAALALVLWQWRPLPQLVWSVEDPAFATTITAISWLGWGLLLASTFLISHFQLFGLSQGFAKLIGELIGDGVALSGVAKYPARVKCALLSWMAFTDALQRSGISIPASEEGTR